MSCLFTDVSENNVCDVWELSMYFLDERMLKFLFTEICAYFLQSAVMERFLATTYIMCKLMIYVVFELGVACVLSRVQLFATSWTLACQPPLSVEFSRQEYWSRLPFFFSRGSPLPRDRTCTPLCLLHWQMGSLPAEPPGKTHFVFITRNTC